MRMLLAASLMLFTVSTLPAQEQTERVVQEPLFEEEVFEKEVSVQKSYDSRFVADQFDAVKRIGDKNDVTVKFQRDGQMVVQGLNANVEAFARQIKALEEEFKNRNFLETYPLKHIKAESAAEILAQLKLTGVDSIVAVSQSNSLIVKGSIEGSKQVKTLLVTIDIPEDRGNPPVSIFNARQEKRITSYSLKYIPAKEAAEMLKQLNFTDVVPDTNKNSVIHRADESDSKQAKKLLELLDTKSTEPAQRERDAEATLEVESKVSRKAQYEQSERKAAELAAQLREAKASQDAKRVKSISASLRTEVEQAFKLRIQIQQSELDEAEAALKASRDRLARRQQIADAIITRRIQELESGEDSAIGLDAKTDGPTTTFGGGGGGFSEPTVLKARARAEALKAKATSEIDKAKSLQLSE